MARLDNASISKVVNESVSFVTEGGKIAVAWGRFESAATDTSSSDEESINHLSVQLDEGKALLVVNEAVPRPL